MTDTAIKERSAEMIGPAKEPEPLSEKQVQAIEDELVRLAVHINCATYKMLCLIRELDVHGAALRMGFASTAHYLNWRIGLDMVTAREKVRVARALPDLPLTSKALGSGRISYAKARAITRIATPETEETLLQIALYGTAAHVDKVVRLHRRTTRRDAEQSEQQYQGRYLHTYHDDNGMLVIEARLPPEEGAVLTKALEAAQELVFKKARGTPDAPAGAQQTERTPTQKRADALGVIARAALGHGLCSDAGGKDANAPAGDTTADSANATAIDGARYQVVVHVDADVIKDVEAPGQCELEHGPVISPETLRRITCDSDRVVMTHGPDGEILDVGRKTRAIPTAMRRALAARDHGCRFPGCDRTRFVDAHHLEHWADGGKTKLSNLVELCRHHHRFLHEGGYKLRRGQDDTIELMAPSGRVVANAGLLAPADDEAFSAAWREIQENAASGAELTAWNGETCDYGWVMENLLTPKETSAQTTPQVMQEHPAPPHQAW